MGRSSATGLAWPGLESLLNFNIDNNFYHYKRLLYYEKLLSRLLRPAELRGRTETRRDCELKDRMLWRRGGNERPTDDRTTNKDKDNRDRSRRKSLEDNDYNPSSRASSFVVVILFIRYTQLRLSSFPGLGCHCNVSMLTARKERRARVGCPS